MDYTPPPIVVPNPIVVKAAPRDYHAACAAVRRGETVTLAVGVTPEPGDYSAPTGTTYDDGRTIPPGRYRVTPPASTPAVQYAPYSPFTQSSAGAYCTPGRT